MAGLSPATFGYEKIVIWMKLNVVLSANASETTIEAIKTINRTTNKQFTYKHSKNATNTRHQWKHHTLTENS